MNNLLPYCGLVDAKIRASDKDLPVLKSTKISVWWLIYHQTEFSQNASLCTVVAWYVLKNPLTILFIWDVFGGRFFTYGSRCLRVENAHQSKRPNIWRPWHPPHFIAAALLAFDGYILFIEYRSGRISELSRTNWEHHYTSWFCLLLGGNGEIMFLLFLARCSAAALYNQLCILER